MDKSEIIEKLKEHYEIDETAAFVYLFGSYAREKNKKHSDIDIAVYMSEHTYIDLFKYRIEQILLLQEMLKKSVDVVILNNTSPILANQVFRHGQLIKCSDNRLLSRFRIENFYRYLDQIRLSKIVFQRNKIRIKESIKNG